MWNPAVSSWSKAHQQSDALPPLSAVGLSTLDLRPHHVRHAKHEVFGWIARLVESFADTHRLVEAGSLGR